MEKSSTDPVQNTVTSDPWRIEGLISWAFNRTKDRFVSYFLALILSFLISLALVVAFLVVGGLTLFLVSLTRQPLLIGSFAFLLLLLFLLAMYYLSSLCTLLTTQVIIQDQKVGVMESLKGVWPAIWGYVWLLFLISLFLMGLLPFGFLTLGVVLILWSFWSSFSVFIFLEKRKGGLYSLWLSKSLIDQRFWGVAGRLLLLNASVIFISLILAASKNSFLEIVSFAWGLLAAPFILSFSYEIYRLLPSPEVVKRPTGWVISSIVGWLLLFLLVVGLISSVGKLLKDFSPSELMSIYGPVITRSLQNQQGSNPFSIPDNLNLQNPSNLVPNQPVKSL